MAIVTKKTTNFASFRGSPSHDTIFDKLEWDFDARNIKIIVKQGSTAAPEISINGADVHCALPIPEATMNALIYDFDEIGLSRLFIRKTGADVEIYAYGRI